MGTKYGLKLVWPDWPDRIIDVIGFSGKKENIAKEFMPGDKMLIYATSPTKRIIAEVEVTRTCEECLDEGLRGTKDHGLPVGIGLIYGPVSGISLEASGINFKPSRGLTYIPLSRETYEKASTTLRKIKK